MKALLFLAAAATAQACLWDADTLAMEKARFPEVADIIAGKFPRHSREFYEWRKKQSLAQLARDPKVASAYDDLAVAQHKLGDHRGAIDTMLKKEAAVPGLYETYSNLGTFYIYDGNLNEALKWIDQALALNANAHFGREKYQKWLVEWLQAGKPQNTSEPSGDFAVGFLGFACFIKEKSGFKGDPTEWKEGRAEALKGITGMMRFADFDNPLLLEALGDVLVVGKFEDNASLLAAQAYLLASRCAKEGNERQRLWKKMEQAGSTQDNFIPRNVSKALEASLAAGNAYAKGIWSDEKTWISKGVNVAEEFEKKYLSPKK